MKNLLFDHRSRHYRIVGRSEYRVFARILFLQFLPKLMQFLIQKVRQFVTSSLTFA